ncbi:hypothetical protein OXYTRIMIC_670 [Oxytricha trifallax]|uniref:Uncharacterized protein n=1 Tax=Oxytricha trifallax TaxID=1172189 RepID=A0A073IBU7_9SPIT|nr:hypothetical protein OXYTRIMIC_670 [Oxytricha trifallax]
MGILNAQDQDLIYMLAENKKFKQLAAYTTRLIKNNRDQWGLYILEAITFIIKRIVRKVHEHINQYQIELNKLQYLPEYEASTNQIWIIQTYQLLRLLRVNNKFIKPQTLCPTSPNITEIEESPAPGPQITTKREKVLAPLNIVSQPFYPEKQFIIKPPKKIEKKIIYQDDDNSDWSDEKPVFYSDESYEEDSSQQTIIEQEYLQEKQQPQIHIEDREYYKDLLNLSDDTIDNFLKYNRDVLNQNQKRDDALKINSDALTKNQYQIGNNQLIKQDPTINQQQQIIKQRVPHMNQQITKAELQDRLDKREACISIWTQSINSEYYGIIEEFARCLRVISPLTKDTAKDLYDKTDDMLKAYIKTHLKFDPSATSVKMLKFFSLIIMKNSEANEKSFMYMNFETEEHTNRVKIYLKCLQKHTYFIKSDLVQFLTTRLKEQIALKEISFSIRIQPLDNKLKFKEKDGYIQILNGKKPKKQNNRPKRRQPNKNKKRRQNKRGRR